MGGRKVVGSAQVRTRTAFLQHGSVLLQGTQRIISEISDRRPPAGADAALGDLLGRSVGFEEMAERVADAARTWGGEWRTILRGDAILEQAARLADAYRSDQWTWYR